MDQIHNGARSMDVKICNGKYILKHKIGSGAFSHVFFGQMNQQYNEQDVAIKLEERKNKKQVLFYEAKLIKYLLQGQANKDRSIPTVHSVFVEGEYNVMIMGLLGDSLQRKFDKCGKKFTLHTTLMLFDLMMKTIEYVHSRHFLHRDIKPENFLWSPQSQNSTQQCYLVDFGLARRYINIDTGQHIQNRQGRSMIGNLRYASLNCHWGQTLSRRDDLESLAYMMIYFLKGKLPWQGLKAKDKKSKRRKVWMKKWSTKVEDLCEGLGTEFTQFLSYCRNLDFEAKPDYRVQRDMFKDLFLRSGFEYDEAYDWYRVDKETMKNETEKKSKQILQQESKEFDMLNS